jgi:hypothetical protein
VKSTAERNGEDRLGSTEIISGSVSENQIGRAKARMRKSAPEVFSSMREQKKAAAELIREALFFIVFGFSLFVKSSVFT